MNTLQSKTREHGAQRATRPTSVTGDASDRLGPPRRARADILESADSVMVVVDVPGVAQDDLSVTVEHQVLTVDGRRRWAHPQGNRFVRRVRLGAAIDTDTIDAVLRNGVLTITFSKLPAARRRSVEVRG